MQLKLLLKAHVWSDRKSIMPRLVHELVVFLDKRCKRNDKLVIDDGSGETNRFPEAEDGWTETGLEKNRTKLYRYDSVNELGLYDQIESIEIDEGVLKRLSEIPLDSQGIATIRSFFEDEPRLYRRLLMFSDILGALKDSNEPNARDVFEFLKHAEENHLPVVLQSASMFPCASPDWDD